MAQAFCITLSALFWLIFVFPFFIIFHVIDFQQTYHEKNIR